MYLVPMISLCFCKAFSASSSSANKTKASPVALPSKMTFDVKTDKFDVKMDNFDVNNTKNYISKARWKERTEGWLGVWLRQVRLLIIFFHEVMYHS